MVFAMAMFRMLQAQPPTIQDCLGAIPICQEVYSSDVSLPGSGNYPNEINPNISCTAGELFSVWYTFTVSEAGDFGFVITPNNPDDDYDWVLFDITNAQCEDIFSDASLQVSCNAAGGNNCHGNTGANGMSNYDVQGAGCNNFPPSSFLGDSPFNDFISVEAGNTYVLMVSNWTGSTFGYEIDFGLTDVGVLDFTPPEVEELIVYDCDNDLLTVHFSENVDCATVSDDNFVLSGPGGESYSVAVASDICSAGGAYDQLFELFIDPPLSLSGNYTLQIISEDGNFISDVCGNTMETTTQAFFFSADELPVVTLGPDLLICDGQSVTLEVEEGQGDYVWQDGSVNPAYEVNSSGLYSVTVSNSCGSVSDEVLITLLEGPPTPDLGEDTTLCEGATLQLVIEEEQATFLWQDGSSQNEYTVTSAGDYAVTVSNACGETTADLAVSYLPGISLDLPARQELCEGDTLLLDVTQPIADYLWENGSDSPLRMITTAGVYYITASNDCTVQEAEILVEAVAAPLVELGADTTLCTGQSLELDVTSPGSTYLWEDGSAAPLRALSRAGDYWVSVMNECGEARDSLRLTYVPRIDSLELGEDQYLCDDVVLFDVTAHEQADYLWQDGSTAALYEAARPGLYVVEVSSLCEAKVDSIWLFACEFCEVYIPDAFSPNRDGRNDLFQVYTPCELIDYQLDVYSRWGARVFTSTDPQKGWDGTFKGEDAASGMYAWSLTYRVMVNGQVEERQSTGGLALLR